MRTRPGNWSASSLHTSRSRFLFSTFSFCATQLLAVDYDTYEDEVAVAYQTGAEVSALGLDWKLLIEVIVPIIISILQGLLASTDDE